LMGAFKYVAITSLSLVVLQGALSAGDDVAKQLVNNSDKFGAALAKLIGLETLTNPVMVFLLGVLCFLLALVQWIFGFIRQAGIVVLASMIAFAAAGQLSSWGRQWFPRIASAIVALVLYKPMAAMIYSIGFTFMGTGHDLSTAVIGVMVIALAVIALPAMMKFFSFVGNGIGGGGGGGGLALAAAGGAAASRFMGGGGGGGEAPAPQGNTPPAQAPDSPTPIPAPVARVGVVVPTAVAARVAGRPRPRTPTAQAVRPRVPTRTSTAARTPVLLGRAVAVASPMVRSPRAVGVRTTRCRTRRMTRPVRSAAATEPVAGPMWVPVAAMSGALWAAVRVPPRVVAKLLVVPLPVAVLVVPRRVVVLRRRARWVRGSPRRAWRSTRSTRLRILRPRR